MNKIYFEVEGDVVIKYTPVPGIDNTYKNEVVMTKDIFQECYKKWIKQEPQEPKTGHWIIMGDRYIKCSECGHITKTESPDIYNFCMVCGKRCLKILHIQKVKLQMR